MNTELLNRLVRIQFELNSIMIEIASQPPSSPITVPSTIPTESEKKGPGRPRKEKKERDPNKPKKVLSPEHLAKLKEGRDRRAAEKAVETTLLEPEDSEIKVVDITPPHAPKKGRGRPHKIDVTHIPAPDFSSADTT